MSIIIPGSDKKYLIQQAMNAKTLRDLGIIEDAAHPQKEITPTYYNKFPFNKKDAIEAVKDKSPNEILDYAGIKSKKLKDGTKGITQYCQPSINYTYSDIGVNEKDLIKDVTKVFGNLNLLDTSLESTENIHTVNGDVSIGGKKSSLKDLSSLKEIYGSILIHSKSKEEAFETLNKLNFNPKRFTGKVIVL